MGIVLTTLSAFRREFASGALMQVLPEWDLGSVDVHAVFTTSASLNLRQSDLAYVADTLPRAQRR